MFRNIQSNDTGGMEEMASERTRLLPETPPPTGVRFRGGNDNLSNTSTDLDDDDGGSPHMNRHLRRLTKSLSTASIWDEDGEPILSLPSTDSSRVLGTFAGVFCPVAMSMFSTLLYLRAGFVVGQAGLLETYSQLILAYFILVMTVLSICAISTNGALEGGGAYYMISRALGPEFGGSIGFLFYVANILSTALYTTGFVEGIVQNFGEGGSFVSDTTGLPVDSDWWKYLYATVSLFICLLICIVGGAMFARTSAIILLIVIICTLSVIISIFVKNHHITVDIPKTNEIAWSANKTNVTGNYTGLSASTFRDNMNSNYTIDYNTDKQMDYATVFAILFSSVTGILNGANMSGELKDPSKAIPKGTMTAVCFTFATYMIMSTLIAGSCDRTPRQPKHETNLYDPGLHGRLLFSPTHGSQPEAYSAHQCLLLVPTDTYLM